MDVNQQCSPGLLAIHSQLKSGQHQQAWQWIDQTSLYTQPVPRSTVGLMISSLQSLINTNLGRLTLDFSKLERLFYSRLETVTNLVRKKQINLSEAEYMILLELHGKLNQVAKAESLFRNAPYYCHATLSVESYNKMMAVYLQRFKYVDEMTRKRLCSKLVSVENEMQRKSILHNTTTYNLLLAAHIKLQHLQGAEAIFARMKTKPDRTTFNILLNGRLKSCRNNRDREMTAQWMEKMAQSGIAPNRKTFHSVLDGLSNQVGYYARMGEVNHVKQTITSISHLYNVMREMGIRPDTVIVNTMMRSYSMAGDADGVDRIYKLLAIPEPKGGCGGGCGGCGCGTKMAESADEPEVKTASKRAKALEKKRRVKPDAYTCNILIHHHLGLNKPDKAFQMYDTMVTQLDLAPDTITYGNFIWYYGNRGDVDECLKYVDVMKKKGIPFNNYIYNTLLWCSKKYRNPKIIPHLHSLLADPNVSMDSIASNIQFNNPAMLSNNFELFQDLVDASINASSSVSTRTLNTILNTSGKYLKSAPGQYNDTIAAILDSLNQVRPDTMTFALELRNAAYQGNMVRAEHIYKTMVNLGIKPNDYVFSHLIYGYSKSGKLDKAREVLSKARQTPINYAPLMVGYAEVGEYEKAYQLFRDMLDKDIKPDLPIYTVLANVFLKSPAHGDGKRAIELLEGIVKQGNMAMDPVALTLLVDAYGADAYHHHSDKYLQRVEEIYQTLHTNDWLDAKAITSLLSTCVKMKQPEKAWHLWNELKNDGKELSKYHYNTLLSGLIDHKAWYPVAKAVFDEMHVEPDSTTLDLMIWGAYSVSDYETIQKIWKTNHHTEPLLVRTYFAAVTAMLHHHDLDAAKDVYGAYQKLTHLPSSTTVWKAKLNTLAMQQDLALE